jgi:hypothetical protein
MASPYSESFGACGLFPASLSAAFLQAVRIPEESANRLNENPPRNSLWPHYYYSGK